MTVLKYYWMIAKEQIKRVIFTVEEAINIFPKMQLGNTDTVDWELGHLMWGILSAAYSCSVLIKTFQATRWCSIQDSCSTQATWFQAPCTSRQNRMPIYAKGDLSCLTTSKSSLICWYDLAARGWRGSDVYLFIPTISWIFADIFYWN